MFFISSLKNVKDIARAAHRARIAQPHSFDILKHRVLLGGYSSEVPPLPIPNREVKLTNADGTAYLGGRVGSRLFKSGLLQDPTFFMFWSEDSSGIVWESYDSNNTSRVFCN